MATIFMRACDDCGKVDSPLTFRIPRREGHKMIGSFNYFCPDCLVDRIIDEVFMHTDNPDLNVAPMLPEFEVPKTVDFHYISFRFWRQSSSKEWHPVIKVCVQTADRKCELRFDKYDCEIGNLSKKLKEHLQTLPEDTRYLKEPIIDEKRDVPALNNPLRTCTECKEKKTSLRYLSIDGPAYRPRRQWIPICRDCFFEGLQNRLFITQEDLDSTEIYSAIPRGTGMSVCTDHFQFALNNITPVDDFGNDYMFTVSYTEKGKYPRKLLYQYLFHKAGDKHISFMWYKIKKIVEVFIECEENGEV